MKKLIFIIIALSLLTACNESPNKSINNCINTRSTYGTFIDTILIHGNKHEIILWQDFYKGGIMHSPECWCLKEDKKL